MDYPSKIAALRSFLRSKRLRAEPLGGIFLFKSTSKMKVERNSLSNVSFLGDEYALSGEGNLVGGGPNEFMNSTT